MSNVTDVAYKDKTEAQWQAETDAETLAKAEVIKGDPGRLGKAQTAAAEIAENERKEAAAMSKVAGRKAPSGSGSGGNRKGNSTESKSGRAAGGNKMSGHNVFQKI